MGDVKVTVSDLVRMKNVKSLALEVAVVYAFFSCRDAEGQRKAEGDRRNVKCKNVSVPASCDFRFVSCRDPEEQRRQWETGRM